jgi:hypothetical protein
MESHGLRSLAVRAAVTAVLVVVASLGLFYSGVISDILPRDVLIGD